MYIWLRNWLSKMATHIKKMLSSDPTVSSKRVIGFTSFIVVLIISFKILFAKTEHPNETLLKEVLYTLFLIIAATVLGGTVENIMRRPSDVMSQPQPEQPNNQEPTKDLS